MLRRRPNSGVKKIGSCVISCYYRVDRRYKNEKNRALYATNRNSQVHGRQQRRLYHEGGSRTTDLTSPRTQTDNMLSAMI
ncbi:hypothetical protein QTP88_008878 [Uroleucon formosanum]